MQNRKQAILLLLIIFLIAIIGATTTTSAQTNTTSISLSPIMYNPTLDTGYTLTNKVQKTVYNSKAYTTLSVQSENGKVTQSYKDGMLAYGVCGENFSVYLTINHKGGADSLLNGNQEWMLCNDSWGKEDGETVNGITTGEVGTGALIVQTSNDGFNWSKENKARYTEGLYTTDYYNHYKTQNTCIYTPAGKDISTGLYIRVLYAYEVYDYNACTHENNWWNKLWGAPDYEHENDNEYKNYVEIYTFYVCSNSPESVTFHNLSLSGEIENSLIGEDKTLVEMAKRAETLKSESVTTTGFRIDKTLNYAATVTVKKNGQPYTIPDNNEIRDNGRYDITVKTPLGAESTTTIYVYSKTPEELYSLYFGESLLSGKRIFTKDELPTYEGGITFYNLLPAVDENFPWVSGTITNKTTNTITTIEQTKSYNQGLLHEAGEYEIRLNTNKTYNSNSPSGDNYSFVFRFIIIPNGTAPGPQVNKESLINFSNLSNPSNLRSTYYGVTFQSAHRGYITLAFASRKAAIDYAYNYEKGMVEVQSDGSFRYNGSLVVSQKIKYESAWDLTDAIYFFAEQAVQKLHFDLREEFTYLTLSDEVLSSVENIRTLELTKSVIIFANDSEKEQLLQTGNLPIINSRKYAYLQPGANGEVVSGYSDFKFVKDTKGYDSDKVIIVDAEGNRFPIEYNKSVEEQLKTFGCKSGIITVEETTIYGDVSKYQAIYISENHNSAKINIKQYDGTTDTTTTIDINNDGEVLNVEAFSIESIVDELDSYGLLIIAKAGTQDIQCIDEDIHKIYTEEGAYIVTLVNRFGYSYSFTINIEEQIYYTSALTGEGIDGSQIIMYADGETIKLPNLERYGYNFMGYASANGTIYSDEVQAILLKGSSVLEAVWTAKQFNLVLNANDAVYDQQTITFGETYTLPTLESTKDKKFVGWRNANGEYVSAITVNTEGDINLTAQFEITENAFLKADERGISWFTGICIIVGSIILMGIAHHIIVKKIYFNHPSWMWFVSTIALVALLIFVPLPWWALALIEAGVILLMVGFIYIVEAY